MFGLGGRRHSELLAEITSLRKEIQLLREERAAENLPRQIKSLRNKIVSPEEIEGIVSDRIKKSFRFSDSLAIALATHSESLDNIFTIYYAQIGCRFFLPNGRSDHVQREIIRTSDFYETKTLSFLRNSGLIPSAPAVVDVGANIGNHSVFFGKIMNASSIVSFEPNPPVFSILSRNIELNDLSKITQLYCAAAGNAATKARSAGHKLNNLGENSIVEDEAGDIDILRLDDLNLSVVHFLKIDVEGYGSTVVDGASRLISTHRPTILMEVSSNAERDAVQRLQNESGYRVHSDFGRDLILTAH